MRIVLLTAKIITLPISFHPAKFILLLLAISLAVSASAAHIVGGEMTYRCLGFTDDDPASNSRRYEFTINLYRDCFGGGSEFDSPNFIIQMHITVYQGRNRFGRLELGGPVVTNVNVDPGSPCVIVPSNVCVEEGVYVWEMDLPIVDESYQIVYQRCCRNNTISNIVDPGGSGSTYTIEVTPEAQQSCNSSPRFREYPPAVICAGTPFEYDFSAEDDDGDLLVYEFCSPFLGGGNQGNQGPANGVAPDPDLPPPYTNVFFFAPTYTATRPLGAEADLVLNPSTGIMTGTPVFRGQFVVGVCVSEFRDGQLLSTVRRDFQFNVSNCEVTVFADLREDSLSQDGQYIVSSCGLTEVNLTNESGQAQFIDSYEWRFDVRGEEVVSTSRDFAYDFEGLGTYSGTMIVNPNSPDCSDTAEIVVNVFPGLESNFTYAYDTCVANPVTFANLSTTEAGQAIVSNRWQFGDGVVVDEIAPRHFYQEPGDFPVRLTVEDVNGCQDVQIENIRYFPVPELIVIAPSSFEGCTPAEIFFDNLSTPIDERYLFDWSFGDGSFGTDLSPTHIYELPGLYSVALEITSPLGCQTDTIFRELIKIEPAPTAGFSLSPEQLTNFEPEAAVMDESLGAFRWFYNFNDEATFTIPNPTYAFRDTGQAFVRQVVTHRSGCIDTLVRFIDVKPEITFYFPNAFTPNGDGANDDFRGKGFTRGFRFYELNVWNRWGEPVFQTNDPFEGWTGRKNNAGRDQPPGIYLYDAVLIGPRGEEFTYQGYVTLVR
jgi:gliding motility-associated-like protein